MASGSKDGEENSVSFAAIKHCRFGCQGVCVHVCACPDLILLHLLLKDQFEFELFWKLKLLNNFILVGVGLDQ